MIAVTGANGQLGRLVLKALIDKGETGIKALVRSPEKALDLASDQITLVQADYDKPETLQPALDGITRLLIISGSEVGKRAQQHRAIIEAAKAKGVGFIAYTSILRADTSPMKLAEEHKVTEELLTLSGIPYALLRNGWYIENYAGTVAAALEHGAVVGASGDGRISAASRADYAEAAASVIAGSDLSTRAYELAGAPGLTLAELAAEISDQTGKTVPFQNMPEEAYADMLKQAGLPGPFAEILADSDACAAEGSLYSDSKDLQTLIGHDTLSVKDFVRATVK